MRKPGDEELCEYCQEHILQCQNVTSTFMCEGRFCVEALESWQDNEANIVEDNEQDNEEASIAKPGCFSHAREQKEDIPFEGPWAECKNIKEDNDSS